MANNSLEERLAALYQKRDHIDQFYDADLKTIIDAIRDAREHGGTASVDITPISGGGGYTITITDSEGTEHTATVKDGGDAYEVYKSTVPSGQTPMSKADWLASLKGSDGQNGAPGHNPCLGRFNVLPTLSPNSFADARAGDYLYYDTTDSQTSDPVTYIYHFDGTNWDAQGTAVDVSNLSFGSGQSVPSVAIKDLNGDNDQNAAGVLSAEAGKALNDQLNKVEEVVGDELVGEGKPIDTGSYWTIGIDTTTNNTKLLKSNTNGRGNVLDLSNHRGKFAITGADSDNYTIISFFIKHPKELANGVYTLNDLKTLGYVDSNAETLFEWCTRGTSKIFEIPASANYLYVAIRRTTGVYCVPLSAHFIDEIGTGLKYDVERLAEDVGSLQVSMNTLGDRVQRIDEEVSDISGIMSGLATEETTIITKSDLYGLSVYPSTSTTKWTTSIQPGAAYYLVVKKGQILHIDGKSSGQYTNGSYIALVPNVPIAGDNIIFSQNEGAYRVATGQSLDITVENDCVMYIWARPDSTVDIFPERITLTETTVGVQSSSPKKITRANINMFNEEKMLYGTIDQDGEVTVGDNVVSDFIDIKLGGNTSYQVTEFIHACSMDSNGSFGYRALQVAVYGIMYDFLGFAYFESYIDKKDVENGNNDLFAVAKYIRVEFSSTDSSFYVSNANDRNLPAYSIYNEKDLSATKDYVADKIHNCDGALTKMLKAALSYVGRGSVTNLGYGDSNTAFDQYVNAVVCDSWNYRNGSPRYAGEKKQINCSAFVQLALQGIDFENSRYVLGSDRQNIITNYRFDSKATYNYRNGYAAPGANTDNGNNPIYCSDYGKLYANTLAKYAEDRGMLFKINDDLSNIEVGDVIFAKIGGSGTYRGIGHVLFVANVRENKNGSKTIDIMEVSSQDGDNLAFMNTKTTRDSIYEWAARFPMPVHVFEKINIVASYANENISVVPTNETLLSTLTLASPLVKANVYTVVGKLSNNPLGKIQPIVKVSGVTYDGNSTSLLQRPDGWFVKHIIIKYNDSLSDMSDVKIYVKSEDLIEGETIELTDVKLYEGFVSI